jgi:hypothetical protein
LAVDELSPDAAIGRDEAPRRFRGVIPWPRASDAQVRVLVWVVWLAAFVSALVLVVANGRDVPVREDFTMAPAMTGHQDDFLGWLWSQNNEHRVPVPRLIYLGLLKLWPDFRVGMVFNVVLLAAIAAAFIVFLHRVRGRSRWTDAFFPIAFLNLGNWENMGWGWQLEFVVATALACGLLMGIASKGEFTTRRAMVVGGCLVGIPLTGATALPFAPLLSLALIPRIRSAGRHARVVLVSSITLTLVVTVLYFVGLQAGVAGPEGTAGATIETAFKFLALGLGTGAGAWWFASALAVTGLLAGAAFVLYRARRRGAWVLLIFLAAGLILAGEVGHSRAPALSYFGLPDRYALIAAPILCCGYLAYERYGGWTARRWGPRLLCAAALVALPLSTVFGLQFRDWYHNLVDPFAAAVKAGTPPGQLTYYLSVGPPDWGTSLVDLHQAGVGVFRQLNLGGAPPPAPGRRVDGLDTGGSGWSTVGGPTSAGTLEQQGGQTVLRWDYRAEAGSIAVLGRGFSPAQNWQDSGAVAITLGGEPTGKLVYVRVAMPAGAHGVQYWESHFADVSTGTAAVPGGRTLVIPWSGFLPVDSQGNLDLRAPIPLSHVVAIVFGVRGQGQGSLTIERVALEPGSSDWGWPWHPALTRHSLPPWR